MMANKLHNYAGEAGGVGHIYAPLHCSQEENRLQEWRLETAYFVTLILTINLGKIKSVNCIREPS